MIDLYDELQEITSALDAGGIQYALIGGLAVSLYTQPRATKDIDLLVSRGDATRVFDCLLPLGYRPHEQAVPLAGGRVLLHRLQKLLPGEYLLLDLLLAHEPPELETLKQRVRLPGTADRPGPWIVTRQGLRELKLLRHSKQDEADLAALEEEEAE